MRKKKALSMKSVWKAVWKDKDWRVVIGELKRTSRGNPGEAHLFEVVAEKLPFEALASVGKELMKYPAIRREGVYMAHDSMGVARYGGRGQIFMRLGGHKKIYGKELMYFSFYIIRSKKHEREIENVILRAAGPQMLLNTRKIREGIEPGRITDYEAGTYFFERQRPKGKKQAVQRRSTVR